MSNYERDRKSEAILAIHLNDVYKGLNLTYERVFDKTRQLRGIDLFLYPKDRNEIWKVDEKAQLHHLNRSLGTFAFEIGYLIEGVHHKGWLFDEYKYTDVYFLVVDIYTTADPITDPKQVESCRILRIGRKRLIKKLAELGVNYEVCYQRELEARENNEFGYIEVEEGYQYHFNLNGKLDERPFNLVIDQDLLLDIGDWLENTV